MTAREPRALRSGIVGTGLIADVHARAVRAAGGVVAGIVGSSVATADAARSRLGAQAVLPDVGALVGRDDIDVIHICTPNSVHAGAVELALQARKAVICEKPLAVDVATAQHLLESAVAAGLVHAVPFVYRFYGSVRDARARILDGAVGAIHLIHGSYLQDWLAAPQDSNWRVDPALGGASRAFADIGVHWCDLVEFTTGQRITRLVSRLLTAYPQRRVDGVARQVDTEDAAAIVFETDHGAIGTVTISQVTQGRKNRLWFSLDGSAASLAFDQELPDSLWLGTRAANQIVMRGSRTDPRIDPYNVVPAGHPQGYQDSFTAFVADVYARVRGAAVDGLPTFEDGLRAARLTDAVLRSAAGGTWVDVV